MNVVRKDKVYKGKRWTFRLIWVSVSVTVTIALLAAGFYLFIGKDFLKKRGIEKGLIYAKVNRNKEAIEIFEKELAKNPENANIHYLIGASYINLKKYDMAKAKFETALEMKPDFPDAHLQLAAISFIKAMDLRDSGKPESLVLEKLLEAEDTCRDVIVKYPNYTYAYIQMGDIHTKQGLTEEAIKDYEYALKLDTSLIDAHISLVNLYIKSDKLKLAEKHCDVVLSAIEPDNYQVLTLLSAIYEQQGNLDKAVDCLKLILKKKPEDLAAHLQLGLIYLKMSKFDEAFTMVEQVRELKPLILPPALNFIEGTILFQRKDYANAIALLKDVTKRMPEFIYSHYVLAFALIESGQLEEAERELRTILDLDRNFIPALSGLARLLVVEGKYDESVNLCNDILKQEPENVDVMLMLGTSYIQLRDFKNAELIFRKIHKLKPALGNTYLARLSFESGHLSKCIRQCEEIINENPDDLIAYELLGLAYAKQGDFPKAIEQFVKALEKSRRQSPMFLKLARVYISAGMYRDAIKTLEDLTSIDTNNVQAYSLLADLYEKEGKTGKAIKTLVKVLAIDPEYLPGYKLAALFLLQGRPDEAIDLCKKALNLGLEDAELHVSLAIAHQEKEDYAASILSCQKAGELMPGMPFLNVLTANIHAANGDLNNAADYLIDGGKQFERKEYAEAVNSIKKITKIMPELAPPHYILALVLTESGRVKEAMKEFNAAMNLDPEFVSARLGLARLQLRYGSLNKAIKLSKDIITIEPDNLDAMLIIGTAYMRLREFKNAEAVFNKISAVKPSLGDIKKAHLSLAKGQLNRSIEQCEQIIQSTPEESSVYDISGLAYMKQGNFDKGIDQFVKAASENKYAVDTLLNLAGLYVITGRYREAEKALDGLIKIQPNNLQANTILASLYEKEGKMNEAANLLENVLNTDPEYLPGYQLAILRLWQGRPDDAIDLCNKALKLSPLDAAFQINLAVAYQQKRDYVSSISSCRKAKELSPESPLPDLLMLNMYLDNEDFFKARREAESSSFFNDIERKEYLAFVDLCRKKREEAKQATLALNKAIAASQRGFLHLAASECEKASEVLPQNLISEMLLTQIQNGSITAYKKMADLNNEYRFAQMSLAQKHLKDGSPEKAVKIAENIMDFYPENIITHNLLRKLLIADTADKSYDDTATHSSKLPHLPDDSSEIVYDRVRFSLAKELVDSIQMFNEVEKKEYHGLITLCQNDLKKGGKLTLSLNKAIVAIQNGFFESAVSESQKAVNILPENLVPKIFLASSFLSAEKKKEAIKIYHEIKNTNPEFVSEDLAKAYLLEQKDDDAVATFKKLVDMNEKSVSTRLTLAGLLHKKGSVDEAVKEVEKAVQLSPENITARNLLGELNLANTRYDNAETEFTKILQLNDSIFEGYYNMARVKYAQDELDECINHCKRGLQINPVDIRLLNILGAAYMKKGMLNYALTVFVKITDINCEFTPAFLNIANIKVLHHDYEAAIRNYKEVLKIDPESAEARSGIGNAYALMGKHTDAIVEFETLREADPGNVSTYFSLIRSYLALGKNEKALEAIMKILDLDPENQTARNLLANIHVRNDEIPEAIDQLKRVLRHNPKTGDTLLGLGTLYMDQGEYDKSASTYKQGIKNFPDNVVLWCNLSIAYLLENDFKNAKEACSRALNIQPDNIIANLCLINVFLSQGEFEKARQHLKNEAIEFNNMQKTILMGLIKFFDNNDQVVKIIDHLSRSIAYANNKWLKRVIKENDDIKRLTLPDTNLYSTLAGILILAGGDNEAIEICKKVIVLAPASPHAYNQLAGIYQHKEKPDKAEELYKKVLRLDPDNAIAHMNVGVILQSKDLINESVREYKRVIELDPSSSSAYNNLAWLYATRIQGKMNHALELSEKARKLEPENADIIDTYGWICYLSGKYNEALSELKIAAAGAPENPTIHYHLGMAYYKNNLHILALNEMEHALRLSSTFPEAKEASELIEKISFSEESKILGF